MRPRLAVATTFPVHPRLGGGQLRVFNLYRRLARWFDIEIVSLTPAAQPQRRIELAAGLREVAVPKSKAHEDAELELEREVGEIVTDVAMADLFELSPGYLEAVRAAGSQARAVVACHPYTYGAIRAACDAPLWFEAQDIEASLKAELLEPSETSARLLETVERVESECCREAEWIWACSETDRAELITRYAADAAHSLVVPNGADLQEVRFVAPAERAALRDSVRLSQRPLAVFVASWHGPNITAARHLLRAAERTPGVDFLVLGSAGLALDEDAVPDNVQLAGPVSAGAKQDALSVADVALNLVTSGSGQNLKMLEYFGAGIPVISTAFGARGLGVQAGVHYTVGEPGEMPPLLRRFSEAGLERREAQVCAARQFVEDHLSWDVVVERLAGELGLDDSVQPRGEIRRSS